MLHPYSAPSLHTERLSSNQVDQLRSVGHESFLEDFAAHYSTERRLIKSFRLLIVGRDDAYLDEQRKCVKQQLTDAILLDHLRGQCRIGAYGLLHYAEDYALAKFLAIDIDGKNLEGGRIEALRRSNAVAEVLEELGLPAYREESRSRLGFHVWVFYGSNRVSLSRSQELGRLVNQIAGLPANTEVFPKGAETDPFGGTPYAPLHGILSVHPTGALFVRPDGSPHDDQMGFLSEIQCVTPTQVDEAIEAGLAREYSGPNPQQFRVQGENRGDPGVRGAGSGVT